MKGLLRWPLIIAIAAGGALLLSSGSSHASGPITKEERSEYRRFIRKLGGEVEAKYGIEGMADYLDAVAYWESKYNPTVAGDSSRSIGLYQMQAGTAFRQSNGLTDLRPQADRILRDPTKATLLAVDYAVNRVKRSRQAGGPGDWFAVRRGWYLPVSTADVDGSEYPDAWNRVLRNFTRALKAVGLPVTFMDRQPDVSGYPGIQQMLDDFNVNLTSAASA